jgi:nucleotide-binding universal stress UspA family protein
VVLHVIEIKTEAAIAAHAGVAAKRRESENHLKEIKKMAEDQDIDCDVLVCESYQPDRTIIDEAWKHNADVIIMGRHGRRGLLKLLVGSMTSRIIGYGFPKVLVVPKDFTITGEKLLIATDGSKFSKLAAREAISLATHCSNLKQVFAVSVAEKEENLSRARQNVDEVLQEAKKANIDNMFELVAAVGKAGDVICQTAKTNNVDMILVGGYGESGIMKKIMGHVTEDVIGCAHCAVLVVEE